MGQYCSCGSFSLSFTQSGLFRFKNVCPLNSCTYNPRWWLETRKERDRSFDDQSIFSDHSNESIILSYIEKAFHCSANCHNNNNNIDNSNRSLELIVRRPLVTPMRAQKDRHNRWSLNEWVCDQSHTLASFAFILFYFFFCCVPFLAHSFYTSIRSLEKSSSPNTHTHTQPQQEIDKKKTLLIRTWFKV